MVYRKQSCPRAEKPPTLLRKKRVTSATTVNSQALRFFKTITMATAPVQSLEPLINSAAPTIETEWREFKGAAQLTATQEPQQIQDKVKEMWSEVWSGFANSPRERVMDCIFPVLVTTAELRLAKFDISEISLQTGNFDGKLSLNPYDWLILKHPFSVIGDTSLRDFRNDPPHEQDWQNWSQVHRESLFVVTSAHCQNF